LANSIEAKVVGADHLGSAFAQLIGRQDLLANETAHSGLTDLEVRSGFCERDLAPFGPFTLTVGRDVAMIAQEAYARAGPAIATLGGLAGAVEQACDGLVGHLAGQYRDELDHVERAWYSAGATPATRKRIVRTVIEEIVVRVEDEALCLVIRWAGGDHTPLRVRKNRAGQHRWTTDNVRDCNTPKAVRESRGSVPQLRSVAR
jgi:hypothetical protein